jgi:hypothetical protein
MTCEATNYVYIIVTVGGMLLEYWLGKTDKTKSGSLVELIINIVKKILTIKTRS